MTKRMAIFTVSIGHGHHQVSRALKEEWEGRGFEAEIIDIFSKMEKPLADKLKKAYFYSIYRLPQLWDWTYRFTNLKVASPFFLQFFQRWGKDLVSYCNQQEFDYIVTTHPMATQLGRVFKRKAIKPCRLFAVLTDFSTHSFSISKEIDGIFVAEALERKGLEDKQPDCTFYSYGIPLTQQWDSIMDKDFYRRKLAMPLRGKIVVIAGGGEGVYQQEQIMEFLKRETFPIHVYWFLGRGQGEKESQQLSNGTNIYYLPFSKAYPDYVKAADLFLSKPGGVSMAEVLRWQIPTGILPPLPGQEKVNQQVLSKYPQIKIWDDSFSLKEALEELDSPSRAMNVDAQERGCARKRIVDCILQHKSKTKPKEVEVEGFFSRLLGKPFFTSTTRNT